MYLSGCACFSFGALLYIQSNYGVDPMDALAIGVARHLHSTIGIGSGLLALTFLLAWSLANRKRPPLMPFVTMFLVGSFIDLWLLCGVGVLLRSLCPAPSLLLGGVLCCSYGSALIIMSGIGIRTMDLLAITLVRQRRWSFFGAKMVLEVGIFGSAWLLGGPIGPGTWVVLLLMGPCIQPFMLANDRWLRLPNHGLATSCPGGEAILPASRAHAGYNEQGDACK